ncbi:MAG: phosphopantothenoylcysteine decarboxylase, partial [Coriobacteriia bacterium]|nr:phosphopantothenoylcysteine decarboxylase [Coriobacteriia bacterium]
LPDPFGCSVVRVQTAEEMYRASMEAYAGADAVVASAAVSDLRPATESARKIGKSEAPDTLALERTTDILARMGESKGSRVLVGFAAESHDPIDGARAKLQRKALDLVVANDITQPGLGFGSAFNRVSFVTATGVEEMPVMPKRELACRICDRLVVLLRDRTRPVDDTIEGTRT